MKHNKKNSNKSNILPKDYNGNLKQPGALSLNDAICPPSLTPGGRHCPEFVFIICFLNFLVFLTLKWNRFPEECTK